MDLSLGTGERTGQIVAVIYFLSPAEHGDFFLFHPCFSRDFPLAMSLHMTELKPWASVSSLLVCSSFEDQSAVRTRGFFRESVTGKMKKRNLSLWATDVSWESGSELREFRRKISPACNGLGFYPHTARSSHQTAYRASCEAPEVLPQEGTLGMTSYI